MVIRIAAGKGVLSNSSSREEKQLGRGILTGIAARAKAEERWTISKTIGVQGRIELTRSKKNLAIALRAAATVVVPVVPAVPAVPAAVPAVVPATVPTAMATKHHAEAGLGTATSPGAKVGVEAITSLAKLTVVKLRRVLLNPLTTPN